VGKGNISWITGTTSERRKRKNGKRTGSDEKKIGREDYG
tara:strand:- start:253 stop:369 length:117 start_codon:yes stop_codon:yes gene_type:complete